MIEVIRKITYVIATTTGMLAFVSLAMIDAGIMYMLYPVVLTVITLAFAGISVLCRKELEYEYAEACRMRRISNRIHNSSR